MAGSCNARRGKMLAVRATGAARPVQSGDSPLLAQKGKGFTNQLTAGNGWKWSDFGARKSSSNVGKSSAQRNIHQQHKTAQTVFSGGQRIIAIVGLQRGIPSKRESSARVDYVPALCTHRPSLLPIEWSGEVFGSRRRGRFAARDVARSPLNLII
ncbi:UNVERIFIED_CONTAM: hypothetical protein Scaly_3117200 [Sesamum calycinum]|uniref:Uncharacterized protein n=1 Tax=Sesamum calycinum TaxID=2727403 RepID=A0AAW2JJ24_9LAMI